MRLGYMMRLGGAVMLVALLLGVEGAAVSQAGKGAGEQPRLSGVARDAKGGAVVVGDDGEPVYVGGLAAWPPVLLSRRMALHGVVTREAYLPQATVEASGAMVQGATVQAATAPGAKAMQRVLRAGRWELLPEAVADVGVPLTRRTPLVLKNGASVVLDVVTHKQLVDGPVVGVWELSVRKGDQSNQTRFVGERLDAELDAFGLAVAISAEGEEVRARVIEAAPTALDSEGSLAVARALATMFGLVTNATSRSEEAGCHVAELLSIGEGVALHLRIGKFSRRLLPGSYGAVRPSPAAAPVTPAAPAAPTSTP